MGLFDKKVCDFCGGGIGLLGNRKLADGNMCKNCAAKISHYLTGRKEFTVQEMAEHLAYREANISRVQNFMVTTAIGKRTKVYIDVNQCQWFITNYDNYVSQNPDVFDFSQVTGCQVEIQDHRSEVYFTGPDGHRVSFNPPEYDYDYDIYVKVFVMSPFTQSIEFKVNDYRIEDAETYEYYEAKSIADNIKYVFDQMAMGGGQITIPDTFYMDPAEVERLSRERELRARRRQELLKYGPMGAPVGPRTMGAAAGPAMSRPGNPAASTVSPTGPAASRPGNPATSSVRPPAGPAMSRPGNPAASTVRPTGPAASRPGNPAAGSMRPGAGPAPSGPRPGSPRPGAGPAPSGPRPGSPRPGGPR